MKAVNLPPEKGTQTSVQRGESADALAGPTQERKQGGEHGVHVGPPALQPPPHLSVQPLPDTPRTHLPLNCLPSLSLTLPRCPPPVTGPESRPVRPFLTPAEGSASLTQGKPVPVCQLKGHR